MVHGCAAKTIKLLVFTFNFLALLVGVAVLVFSVLAYVKNPVQTEVGKFIGDVQSFNAILYAGMALGSLITLLGFLGCCGALVENRCALTTFALFMTVLAGGQVAVGILLIVKPTLITNEIDKGLEELEKKASNNDTEACNVYSGLLKQKLCCYNDGKFVTGCYNIHSCNGVEKGCKDYIDGQFQHIGTLTGAIIIVVIVIQIMAVILAICLCCSFRSGQRYAHPPPQPYAQPMYRY